MMKKTVIVTGGAGFIGSNFVFHMLAKYPEYRIICLDKLTYAGNLSTLKSVMDNPNFRFVKDDICDREAVYKLFEEEKPDIVVNFAAESHVDRSIENPGVFLETNIMGTATLMDACRKYGIERYHQVSTDEVYGDLPLDRPDLFFTEETPIHTSSPYSSSKASADLLVQAYNRTYGLPVTISRCSNNYGPYPGSAEENFGKVLKNELAPYRDELIISTKAGYGMWDGPYGDHGSRKYLIASLDQSLKRMGLEYVDIFYHHRPDPDTPMEETASALDHIVRSGKALYVGISNYNAEQTKQMAEIMKSLGTPLVIHQPRYNMFERWIENGLQDVLKDEGIGSISFCPLAQGLLTNKYINGIPADSRAAKSSPFLTKEGITADKIEKIVKLNKIAENRGQSLAQMACAWNLRGGKLTSVLLGASKASQIIENVNSLNNLDFTQDELNAIEDALK